MGAPMTSGPPGQRVLAAAICILGLGSVAPLLAWVFGLGSFAVWFWSLAIPGFVFIIAVGIGLRRMGAYRSLAVALEAGLLGGLIATVCYDLVRTPFLALGYRLFAPISTYGILITNASTSSPFTETVGWAYNFMNGVGFAIAYAMFGLGRRWWWAIPFAMALETTTVVTPYADIYGLRGKVDVIVIAYAAHAFYGAALGMVVQRAGNWEGPTSSPVPAWWVVLGVAAVLVAMTRPWSTQSYLEPARLLRPAPAAVVTSGMFQPEWLRVGVGGCVLLVNQDRTDYRLSAPPGGAVLAAGSRRTYCFSTKGTQRVQLNRVPYSGGWVLVDPAG